MTLRTFDWPQSYWFAAVLPLHVACYTNAATHPHVPIALHQIQAAVCVVGPLVRCPIRHLRHSMRPNLRHGQPTTHTINQIMADYFTFALMDLFQDYQYIQGCDIDVTL